MAVAAARRHRARAGRARARCSPPSRSRRPSPSPARSSSTPTTATASAPTARACRASAPPWCSSTTSSTRPSTTRTPMCSSVAVAGMLVRRAVWHAVGGFDPGLPSTDAGLDFSDPRAPRRAPRRAGAGRPGRARAAARGFRTSPSARTRGRGGAWRAPRSCTAASSTPPASSLPVHWLALVPLAVLRSIGQLLAKRPGAVGGEIAAAFLAAFDGSRARRALPAAAGAHARLARDRPAAARRARRCASTAPANANAPTTARGGSPTWCGRPSSAAAPWVVVVALVIGAVVFWRLLGATTLEGGGAPPARLRARQLWSQLRLGAARDRRRIPRRGRSVRPALWAAARLARPRGIPRFSLVLLWITALPLAALGAWWCATRLSERVWPPVAAALLWMLAPAFLAALGDGRAGAVIAHLLLPWLVLALLEGARSWSASAAAALLFAAIVAAVAGARARAPAGHRGMGVRPPARLRADDRDADPRDRARRAARRRRRSAAGRRSPCSPTRASCSRSRRPAGGGCSSPARTAGRPAGTPCWSWWGWAAHPGAPSSPRSCSPRWRCSRCSRCSFPGRAARSPRSRSRRSDSAPPGSPCTCRRRASAPSRPGRGPARPSASTGSASSAPLVVALEVLGRAAVASGAAVVVAAAARRGARAARARPRNLPGASGRWTTAPRARLGGRARRSGHRHPRHRARRPTDRSPHGWSGARGRRSTTSPLCSPAARSRRTTSWRSPNSPATSPRAADSTPPPSCSASRSRSCSSHRSTPTRTPTRWPSGSGSTESLDATAELSPESVSGYGALWAYPGLERVDARRARAGCLRDRGARRPRRGHPLRAPARPPDAPSTPRRPDAVVARRARRHDLRRGLGWLTSRTRPTDADLPEEDDAWSSRRRRHVRRVGRPRNPPPRRPTAEDAGADDDRPPRRAGSGKGRAITLVSLRVVRGLVGVGGRRGRHRRRRPRAAADGRHRTSRGDGRTRARRPPAAVHGLAAPTRRRHRRQRRPGLRGRHADAHHRRRRAAPPRRPRCRRATREPAAPRRHPPCSVSPASARCRSRRCAVPGRLGAGGLAGLAATACAEPTSSTWLVGGAATVGRTTLLLIANPTAVAAEVSIRMWGESGAITAPGMAGIDVGPASSGCSRSRASRPASPPRSCTSRRAEVRWSPRCRPPSSGCSTRAVSTWSAPSPRPPRTRSCPPCASSTSSA